MRLDDILVYNTCLYFFMEPKCWACVCGWFVNKMTNSSCQISLYSMLGVFLRSLCQHSEENVQSTLFETMSLELFAAFLSCFFELLQVSYVFLWAVAGFFPCFFEPLRVFLCDSLNHYWFLPVFPLQRTRHILCLRMEWPAYFPE